MQSNLKQLKSRNRGFTLIELLVVIGVAAIVVSLIYVGAKTIKKQAEKATCLSHMRTIHAGLGNYLAEHSHWPQMPDGELPEEEYYKWWINVLSPYGISEENWLCPSDKIRSDSYKTRKVGTYIPMDFDEHPNTPFRWNQPWLVERGNMHGKGAHIAMPDGSINPSTDAFAGKR